MSSARVNESLQARDHKKRDDRGFAGRIADTILYATLAGPPFLFGSKEPTTVALWCTLLGGALVFAPTRRLQKKHLVLLGGIGFLILCFAFVLHEQLSDHPWIAPFNPIWEKASEALGEQLTPSVSVVRGEPLFALVYPLANVLALLLGIILGADSDRARRGVSVMAWAGIGYAVYGLIALTFDPMAILWREKTAYIGSLTATFINRNTAACYFGSCSAVWLVLLMGAIRRNLPAGPIEWRSFPHHLLHETRKDVLVRFVMLFVCLSAMFMTASRGGTLVSLGVMVVTFMIYFWRDLPRGIGFVTVLMVCIVGSLLLLEILGGNVTSRIDLHGLGDAGRLSAYRSTLKIIADNPWFGTGLGTFPYAFPAYRSGDISMRGLWDIGHSTPLELASEVGVPVAAVVGLAWIVALVVLSGGWRGRPRPRTVPLSALAVSLIGLLHSSFDFSLQIPGYAIVVFALLGLGLSQAVRAWGRSGDVSQGRSRKSGKGISVNFS